MSGSPGRERARFCRRLTFAGAMAGTRELRHRAGRIFAGVLAEALDGREIMDAGVLTPKEHPKPEEWIGQKDRWASFLSSMLAGPAATSSPSQSSRSCPCSDASCVNLEILVSFTSLAAEALTSWSSGLAINIGGQAFGAVCLPSSSTFFCSVTVVKHGEAELVRKR